MKKSNNYSLVSGIIFFVLGIILFTKPDVFIKAISYVFGGILILIGLYKILNYYKSLNYDVTTEEYFITNKDYINYLTNADKLIENTDDASVLNEVCSQILSKYEELVINDS